MTLLSALLSIQSPINLSAPAPAPAPAPSASAPPPSAAPGAALSWCLISAARPTRSTVPGTMFTTSRIGQVQLCESRRSISMCPLEPLDEATAAAPAAALTVALAALAAVCVHWAVPCDVEDGEDIDLPDLVTRPFFFAEVPAISLSLPPSSASSTLCTIGSLSPFSRSSAWSSCSASCSSLSCTAFNSCFRSFSTALSAARRSFSCRLLSICLLRVTCFSSSCSMACASFSRNSL
jgi:hypothetical protein